MKKAFALFLKFSIPLATLAVYPAPSSNSAGDLTGLMTSQVSPTCEVWQWHPKGKGRQAGISIVFETRYGHEQRAAACPGWILLFVSLC